MNASCGKIDNLFVAGYLAKFRMADPCKAFNKHLEDSHLLQALGVVVDNRPKLPAPSFTLLQLLPNTPQVYS